MEKCWTCGGEGFTGSDKEHAPWSFWENLPPGSDIAVRLGWVKKIECESCSGTGLRTDTVEPVTTEGTD
jgi:DnaJ-class molecular chaperone